MLHLFRQSLTYVAAPLLWCFCVLMILVLINHAPPWQRLERITIDLDQGESVVLGRTELAAASAADHHLRIGRDRDHWWIENIATEHRLLLRKEGFEPVRQWQLEPRDNIKLSSYLIEINEVSDRSARLLLNPGLPVDIRLDGHQVYRNGSLLPLCRERETAPLSQRLKQWSPLKPGKPTLMLGGSADCNKSVGLPGVPHQALRITRDDQGWTLQPGPRFNLLRQTVTIRREGQNYALRSIRQPLDDVKGLIAGYSHFDLSISGRSLTLTPSYRTQRVLEQPDTDGRVQQQWYPDDNLTFSAFGSAALNDDLLSFVTSQLSLLATGSVLLATLPLAYRWSRAHQTQPPRRQSLIFGGLLTLFALSFLPFVFALPRCLILANLLLASLVWSLQPLASAMARQLRLLILLLFLLGVVVQLQFALGAAQTHWYSHLTKTATLCAAACWGIMACSLWISIHKPTVTVMNIRWRSLILLTLGLLALQWLVGYEGGLGAFQPVELAKTVLILITAAALTRRLDLHNRDYYLSRFELWTSILGAVLLFLALFAVLLMQLNDHSPMVLMAFWAAASIAAYIYLGWQGRKRYLGLLAPALLLIAMVITSIEREDLQGLALLPQSDRFAVWAQPELHPHSGYQFRAAQTMIQSGGIRGHYLEALTGAQPWIENGAVMNVPALQDDFMPTFLLHQGGGLIAMILVIIQSLTLCAVILAGLRFRASCLRADYRCRALGNFIFLTLAGGVGMLAGHFVVSWGSNLGFLPVMGQPMPMLSSAGSNLILFCVPLLAAAYLSVKETSDESI